jgi:predicted pyridoxine 5'-phosphate oxidase superfamily flavin-nucleotide-binding protein
LFTRKIQTRLESAKAFSSKSEQRAKAILSHTPKITVRNSSSLLPVLVPPKAAGYDAAAFRAAGCSWADLKAAGFPSSDCIAAGCDLASALVAGYDPPSLKAAGFNLAAFRAAGCDWSIIRTAGFSAAEVKAAGCDLVSAHAARYDVLSLIAGFGYDAVASSGCDVGSILVTSPYPPP